MRFVTLFLLPLGAFAQNTATISGKVADHDGIALAKAAIQATRTGSKAVYKAASSENGAFTLTNLPAGNYEVTAIVLGMLPFEKKDIVIAAGQFIRLDIRLEDFPNLNTLDDGRELVADLMSRHPTPKGPTPRTANGKPDFSGVWLPALPESGASEPSPAGQALIRAHQEDELKDFPESKCLPGGLTNFGLFMPYRVLQTPTYLVMIGEVSMDVPWQIYLDGRAHPKDMEPRWMGHSVGRWEGDTLVVDTVGFNGKTWLDLEGRPSSEKMRVTTRLRRPDLGHMEFTFTFDDPQYYTKPWTMKSVHDLAPGEEVGEYVCAENEKDRAHMVGK